MISKELLTVNDEFGNFEYKNTFGSFFIYNRKNKLPYHEETCREIFAWAFKNFNKWIGYHRSPIRIGLLNKFFEYVENKLKLKEKTVFYRTNIKDVIILKVAPFWLKNDTNRGLLTLFLRCGANHYTGSFNKAIYKYRLSRKVIPTIKHFLKGNIVPTYNHLVDKSNQYHSGGFVAHFQYKKSDELKKLLLKS